MSATVSLSKPRQASDAEVILARAASRELAKMMSQDSATTLSGRIKRPKRSPAAIRLLIDMFDQIAGAHAASDAPVDSELTTQQAADALSVSQPALVSLLERGDIPCRKVGTDRRIRYSDLIVYKRLEREARRRALDELAQQAQELGFGY